jgi:hypothetical protein
MNQAPQGYQSPSQQNANPYAGQGRYEAAWDRGMRPGQIAFGMENDPRDAYFGQNSPYAGMLPRNQYQDAFGNILNGPNAGPGGDFSGLRDAFQNQGGTQRYFGGSGGGGLGQGSGAMGGFQGDPMAELEAARQRAESAAGGLEGMYSTPEAMRLQQQLEAQMGGADAPFSESVTRNLFADVADSSAASNQATNERLRRGFANSGIGRSGGQIKAEIEAQRAAGKQTREGKRQIDTTAATENFAARERARQMLEQRQQAKAANQARAADLRMNLADRYQVTGQDPVAGQMANFQQMLMSLMAQGQGGQGGGFGPQLAYPESQSPNSPTASSRDRPGLNSTSVNRNPYGAGVTKRDQQADAIADAKARAKLLQDQYLAAQQSQDPHKLLDATSALGEYQQMRDRNRSR